MCSMTDLLFSCANNFQKLFNVSYDLCLGRKGKLHNIHLTFAQDQFFHLSGLHKLDDLPWLKRVKRERIFEDILCGHLTIETLAKSLHYSDIENRLKYLNCLESFLDSDRLVYRYDPRFHNHSKIQADYLLQNELFSDTWNFLSIRTMFLKHSDIGFLNDSDSTFNASTMPNLILKNPEAKASRFLNIN